MPPYNYYLRNRIEAREREDAKLSEEKHSAEESLLKTRTVARLLRSTLSSSQLRSTSSIEEPQSASCMAKLCCAMRRARGRSQMIEVVSFSQVLVFLVQRRMQMHAHKLQKHLKVELDKEAEIEASAENRQRAQRCPVCKMKEDSLLDQAEQISNEMEILAQQREVEISETENREVRTENNDFDSNNLNLIGSGARKKLISIESVTF